MSYIFKNDVSYFFHHNKKILMIYVGLILGYWSLQHFSNYVNIHTFYEALALNIRVDSGLLEQILFIFTVCVYIYICACIFTKDLKVGMDHIFLRMNTSRWFYYKAITIFIITFLLKLTVYILTIVLVGFKNIPSHLFLVFLSDMIYTSIIEMTVITIYTLTKRNYIFLILFILFLLFFGTYFPISIIEVIKHLYIYMIVLGIMCIGNFILIGKNHIYLFE